ncbi:MFS transporter [Shimwellia blattae]|uniref:Major facilitator superfamily MFS_1 n=1 Tax=Shimwellia blattae (strain ATCC 29907 / DSM 4481 / JCM 1650 / NBRC 105725 / CDC 9005-74) TaxID=630626 RepID=I2B7W4_SHIBC|nr:MFS transporter [Shimwellia blattae]AFJ46618.1 major facilitator superfamily MFS_1 [Shimwellia blattae DSM 4481 = NBRC 105725]GAB80198.1 putative major facilitator superfamily transporter [Shimwellia blattae DSM 4481 = NBRC 105725]VDY64090.1 Inner membrane transport protein yajR [Shimwellia blattae]VEC22222.1 Inner membrane transport protein yajR [Shimwellia blattae]
MFSRFTTLKQIPKGVWVLGVVSLMMDISSEMIHSLLPLFMATTLGASVLIIGLIEGVAEATALILKVFSGVISDYIGKRKGLALLGYGLGALSKPLFALAPSATMIFSARMIDRIGKGIRGAPRDALVADVTPAEIRGAAYGLRQALDTTGAFLGPLLAVALMLLWHNDFQSIFWVAVIPAVIAIALLAFGLKEPVSPVVHKRSNPLRRDNLRQLSSRYWWVVALGAIFTLARFSEAFLVLRAQQMHIPLFAIPLVMVAMNIVYGLSAYPFGKLSDRVDHRKLLQWGLVVLIAADLVLALSGHWLTLLAGVGLWGIHMGMTQGLLAAMVAHTAPPALRGTAFGVFNLVSGIALLFASLGAGLLWETWGAPSTFYSGAVICLLSLLVIKISPVQQQKASSPPGSR